MRSESSSAKSSPASSWANKSSRPSRSRWSGRGQPAGELRQRRVQLLWIGGVDHAQDGLGLSQVDAAGQKGP